MHFHQKTLPQKPMKQATMYTAVHADYPHITAQCIYRVSSIILHLSNHTHHNPNHASILNSTPNTSFNTHNHQQQSLSTPTPPHLHPTMTLTSLSTIIIHTSQNIIPHTPTNPNLHRNTTPIKMHFAPQIVHSRAQTKHSISSQHYTATNTHNKHYPQS